MLTGGITPDVRSRVLFHHKLYFIWKGKSLFNSFDAKYEIKHIEFFCNERIREIAYKNLDLLIIEIEN